MYTYLTSLPPWAKLPNVAVNICKKENRADTSSGSSTLVALSFFGAINGTLLEVGDSVDAAMLSKLTPLSTFCRSQRFGFVVSLLLFPFDVFRLCSSSGCRLPPFVGKALISVLKINGNHGSIKNKSNLTIWHVARISQINITHILMASGVITWFRSK